MVTDLPLQNVEKHMFGREGITRNTESDKLQITNTTVSDQQVFCWLTLIHRKIGKKMELFDTTYGWLGFMLYVLVFIYLACFVLIEFFFPSVGEPVFLLELLCNSTVYQLLACKLHHNIFLSFESKVAAWLTPNYWLVESNLEPSSCLLAGLTAFTPLDNLIFCRS